ncbi:YVTN repeat-like/Quino protein amine dehydrogenase [Trichoderma novae-zelandiae]
MSPSPSPPPFPSSSSSSSSPASPLTLTHRFTRPASRSEITAVGIAPSRAGTPLAYAIFPGAQSDQPWIDTFDLVSQRGYSKIVGPAASFSPTLHSSPLRVGKSAAASSALSAASSSSSSSAEAFPRIATLSSNQTLTVRDFASAKAVLELKEVSAPIAWSPDGRTIAAAEPRQHRIGTWDVRTGTRTGRVPGHIDAVTHAAFAPDATLVTLSRDGTARVTDPGTGRTLYKLEVDHAPRIPRALGVSPDGATVVSVWGTSVHVWMPRHGRLTSYGLSSTRPCEGWPLCVSPDCRYIASWTEEGFDVMDAASGSVVCARSGGPLVTSADFSVDGRVLVVGRINGDVEVWDVVDERV